MGSSLSAPSDAPSVDDGDPIVKKIRTHIGNYMEDDVKRWEKVQESSKRKDGGCSCEGEPKIAKKAFMQSLVDEWEELNTGVA